MLIQTNSRARPSRALASMLAAALLGLSTLVAVAPAAQAQTQLKSTRVSGVSSFEQNFQTSRSNIRRVLYLRPTVAAATPAPVIMALHYGGGSPEAMATVTALRELVRDTGVWVILPDGSGRAWNHDPSRDSDVDVDLLTRVLDNAVGSLRIDPRRIYLMGFSSGGFMAERYACEHPERIAAFGYVASTLLNVLASRCTSTTTVPTFGIHGTADLRVGYQGRVGLHSAPETARFHARRNGCLGEPQRSRLPDLRFDGTTVDLDRWDVCASGDAVRFYTVNNGGHAWPGTPTPSLLLGPTSQDIDATRLFWEFARTYQR